MGLLLMLLELVVLQVLLIYLQLSLEDPFVLAVRVSGGLEAHATAETDANQRKSWSRSKRHLAPLSESITSICHRRVLALSC